MTAFEVNYPWKKSPPPLLVDDSPPFTVILCLQRHPQWVSSDAKHFPPAVIPRPPRDLVFGCSIVGKCAMSEEKNRLMIRKYILTSLMIVSCIINIHAQVPQKMNYQAVIRTSDNQLVVSRAVRMRISLMPDSMNAAASYVETHQVTTNAFGVVQLEIGGGTVVTGSFAAIPWSRGKIFIKTETDPVGGTNYTLTSITQMMSVPYAMYGNDVPVTKSGDTITIGSSKLIIPNSLLIASDPPASLTSGLVAYFPFSGNAGDSSGKGNHGTPIGITLTADRFGTPNKAYQFPGNSNAYINVPVSNTLGISKEISLCAWVYMDGGTINPRIISVMNGACEGYYMASNGYSNGLRKVDACFFGGNNCIEGSCISNVDVESLKWNYLVYTYNATGLSRFYVNGVLINTKSNSPVNNADYTTNISIGRKAGTAFDAWGGKIDDIRIYNRAITHEEVLSLFYHK